MIPPLHACELCPTDAATLLSLLAAGDEGMEVTLLVSGWSMTPFYLHRRTVVILRREPDRAPRGGDAVLFVRGDGTPVLHRILRVHPQGRLTVGGDAQRWTEEIDACQVLARVARVVRRADRPGRCEVAVDRPTYRLAVRLWTLGRWWHPTAVRVYHRIRRTVWHRNRPPDTKD